MIAKKLTFPLCTFLFFSIAPTVFAQTSVNPCTGSANVGDSLCNLSASGIGNVITTAVVILFVAAIILFLFWPIYALLARGEKSRATQFRNALVGAIVGLIIVFLSFFILQVVLSIFGLTLINLSLPQL